MLGQGVSKRAGATPRIYFIWVGATFGFVALGPWLEDHTILLGFVLLVWGALGFSAFWSMAHDDVYLKRFSRSRLRYLHPFRKGERPRMDDRVWIEDDMHRNRWGALLFGFIVGAIGLAIGVAQVVAGMSAWWR